jgi:hypothetical protein
MKSDSHRVDAIALSRRQRPVIKNMPQVGIAARTSHLGADHPVRRVAKALDAARYGFFPEAWPATAGIELGAGVEQQGIAADAVVIAGFISVVMLATEWAFRARLACNPLLFRCQLRTPFCIAFHNFVFHLDVLMQSPDIR